MLYRKFGYTGWKVSAIGIGSRNTVLKRGYVDDGIIEDIVRAAYSSGINIFDLEESCSDITNIHEVSLGKALKKIRSKVYIVSKLRNSISLDNHYKEPSSVIEESFQAVAKRLSTDYIDILLYNDNSYDINVDYLESLKRLKREGHIREFGIATASIEALKKFYDLCGGEAFVVQIEYSYLNKEAEKEILPFCAEKKLAVLIRGPLGQGLLSGKFHRNTVFKDPLRKKWNVEGEARYQFEEALDKVGKLKAILEDSSDMTTAALRYVLSHNTEPIAITGTTSAEQVLKNARAGLRILTKEELKKFKEL